MTRTQITSGISAYVIEGAMRGPGRGKLDPITVFTHDQQGRGRITVACFGAAWTCYFNALGSSHLESFIASCDEQYLASKLQGCSRLMSKKAMKLEEAYLQDIARAVIDSMQSIGA